MMKTVYLLLFILTNSTGADVYKTITMSDQVKCEQQRQWMQEKGIITSNECLEVNYTI